MRRMNTADEPLAKGGLNGGHPPPLPCELPMGGFPCEFGPETERKIPGHGGPVFSAHRLEGRFSDPRPRLEAPAASSRRETPPKISEGAPLGHGGRLPAQPSGRGKQRALVCPRRAFSFVSHPAPLPAHTAPNAAIPSAPMPCDRRCRTSTSTSTGAPCVCPPECVINLTIRSLPTHPGRPRPPPHARPRPRPCC